MQVQSFCLKTLMAAEYNVRSLLDVRFRLQGAQNVLMNRCFLMAVKPQRVMAGQ